MISNSRRKFGAHSRRGWLSGALGTSAIIVLVGASASAVAGQGVVAQRQANAVSSVVAADEAAVSAAEAPVTKWQGPTDTLKPPKNVTLGIVECASVVNGCVTPAQGAAAAAAVLGWKSKIYDGQGTPAGQNNAVTEALSAGSNAILMVGVDPTAIQSSLQEAASKHVPVGDLGQGIAPGHGIDFQVGANYVKDGQIEGEWIVAASGGHADVLPTNDKEYTSTVELTDAAVQEIQKCSGCSLLPQQYFVSTEIGNGLGQRIAELLQKNPKVNYIVGAYDPAVDDMVPAFENAGIAGRLSLVSNVGTPENLGFIAKGEVQKADIVFDNTYMGWAGVDQVIRALLHKPLWKDKGVTDPRFMYDENTPSHLIVKGNLPAHGAAWHAAFNTAAQFSKHWGV